MCVRLRETSSQKTQHLTPSYGIMQNIEKEVVVNVHHVDLICRD
jgi:hypothetical protein